MKCRPDPITGKRPPDFSMNVNQHCYPSKPSPNGLRQNQCFPISYSKNKFPLVDKLCIISRWLELNPIRFGGLLRLNPASPATTRIRLVMYISLTDLIDLFVYEWLVIKQESENPIIWFAIKVGYW